MVNRKREFTMPFGGYYTFNNPGDGDSAYISLVVANLDTDTMIGTDDTLDDGNLSTGFIRGDSSSMDYYLEMNLLP